MTESLEYFMKLLSATIILVNFVQGSPISEKTDRDGIYKSPLHQNDFVKNLKNPCRAKLDDTSQNSTSPGLLISGRENVIRVITGNMKSRLGFVKKHLVRIFLYFFAKQESRPSILNQSRV